MDNFSQDGANNGGDNKATKQWSDVRSKKRKTRSSKDSGSDLFENVDIDRYKTLTTDDKLSVLFTKSNSQSAFISKLDEKIDKCLQISENVNNMRTCIDDHESRILLLEYKSLDLEARSRRKNLLFVGFREERDENCINKISNFIKDKLEIMADVCIDRAHRLGRYKHGSNRPIIVAFRDFTDTQSILSSANKLKDTSYSINRDFPQETVSARKSLWGNYKHLKQKNLDKRVNMAYPAKIIMNGRVICDAFPHWDTIMKGQRVHYTKGNNTQSTDNAAHVPRAPVSQQCVTSTPSRSNSRASLSSEGSDVDTQSQSVFTRHQSRSSTRRGHAPTSRRRNPINNHTSTSLPNSQSRTPAGPDIRRPWDSASNQFPHLQSTNSSH